MGGRGQRSDVPLNVAASLVLPVCTCHNNEFLSPSMVN